MFQERTRTKFLSASRNLDEVGLDRLAVRVKHQPFLCIIQGLLFYNKAKQESSLADADDLYRRAIHYFEMCLQSDPTNFVSLIHCARCHFYLVRSSLLQQGAGASVDANDEYFSSGENYYIRANEAKPNSEATYLLYAQFLELGGMAEKAEKTHLHGLRLNPFSIRNLTEYAQFLRRMGDADAAERFEARADYLRETIKLVNPKTPIFS